MERRAYQLWILLRNAGYTSKKFGRQREQEEFLRNGRREKFGSGERKDRITPIHEKLLKGNKGIPKEKLILIINARTTKRLRTFSLPRPREDKKASAVKLNVIFQKLLRNDIKTDDERIRLGTSLRTSEEPFKHKFNEPQRDRILRPSELGGYCSGYWTCTTQIHDRPPKGRPKLMISLPNVGP
ncbi:hypothetical protein PIB30_000148 [Stylosanthes scabra]|uniref:Uncharacterized protein n=1 Tax=Stylosanthes scabra TaxID=79078 RepID=A0ABU6R2Z5_9FABA|nr:hypothetical protein [Stylosanthes scabra]